MTMITTIQNGFEPMRLDVTAVDVSLDGTVSGYSFDFSDKPAVAYQIGPETNYAEIIFVHGGDSTNGVKSRSKIFGWGENSPAEFIADISITAGNAPARGPWLSALSDATETLYADTIVISEQGHVRTVASDDNANNRIAKLSFDTCGLKYLWPSIIDLSAQCTIRPYIRTF